MFKNIRKILENVHCNCEVWKVEKKISNNLQNILFDNRHVTSSNSSFTIETPNDYENDLHIEKKELFLDRFD